MATILARVASGPWLGANRQRRPGPVISPQGISGLGGFDHRQDAGLQGLGQVGPCFDHGGKVGVFGGVQPELIPGCALPLRCRRGGRFP